MLHHLDRVQQKFLADVGVDERAALLIFNLAPLEARRDMAMLGLIHRTMLGKGPRHFREYFEREGDGQVVDHREAQRDTLLRRSAFGLAFVYNLLPKAIKRETSVKGFQKSLQEIMKARAMDGCDDWSKTFSPRLAVDKHPLR